MKKTLLIITAFGAILTTTAYHHFNRVPQKQPQFGYTSGQQAAYNQALMQAEDAALAVGSTLEKPKN
jgi:hypothetical protein